MDSDLSTPSTPAAPEVNKPKLFVPFILILVCALAIGFGIRYYKTELVVLDL